MPSWDPWINSTGTGNPRSVRPELYDDVDQRLKEIRGQTVEVGDLLRRFQVREMRDQRRQNVPGVFQIDQIESRRGYQISFSTGSSVAIQLAMTPPIENPPENYLSLFKQFLLHDMQRPVRP